MSKQTTNVKNYFTRLINEVELAYWEQGYAKRTTSEMKRVWYQYAEFTDKAHIDKVGINEFLKQEYNISPEYALLDYRQKVARRAVFGLLYYAEYGFVKTIIRMNQIIWQPPFGEVIEAFLGDLGKKGRKQTSTIYNYTFRLNDFSKFLSAKEITSFEDVDPVHITDYLASISTAYKGMSLESVLSQLRVFFRFLYLNEHKTVDLSLLIPKSQIQRRREHLPSIWSDEDIANIMQHIDRGSPSGKRDYAIILLVSKIGLRVSDVVDLKLSNLDWENECLSLNQRKTNEFVTLPLAEIGDAIIDYLKNARPVTDSKHVFVKHIPPFDRFCEKTTFHNIICRYMNKAGIVVDADKSHGLHSLRHSMATKLYKKGVSVEVISGILGQKDPEVARQYIRVDIDQLRSCTISLEVSK